jgi:hypothetical protein
LIDPDKLFAIIRQGGLRAMPCQQAQKTLAAIFWNLRAPQLWRCRRNDL